MDQKLYNSYIKILKNELVPALGCTEPIAIAYAAAKAQRYLDRCRRRLNFAAAEILSKM